MNSTLELCPNISTAGMDYALCLTEADSSFSVCPDPLLCSDSQSSGNVGLAFGLTIGAGLATTLGALLPFVPCIKRSNTRFLAIGLALAAGVMLYVSFTEIWTKSRDNFCCVTSDHFDLATTACFFGGILLTVVLDLIVSLLQRLECGCGCLPQCRAGGERRRSLFPWCSWCWRRRHIRGETMRVTNASIFLDASTGNGVDPGVHSNGVIPMHMSSAPGATTEGDVVIGHVTQDHHRNNATPTTITGHVVTSNLRHETANNFRQNHQTDPNNDTAGHRPITSNSNGTGRAPSLNSDLQHTEVRSGGDSRLMTSDNTSLSVNSTSMSDSTSNFANTSVNELFSNSSLLRMNAIIPETVSMSLAEWQEEVEEEVLEGGGEEGGEGEPESCVGMEVEGQTQQTGNDVTPRYDTSYQEMVSPLKVNNPVILNTECLHDYVQSYTAYRARGG